jgi:hypothetical protein
MSKNSEKSDSDIEYSSDNSNDESSEYSSDESSEISEISEIEFRKKIIPASQRLREAIKQMKEDRKKGTKKEKINYDE